MALDRAASASNRFGLGARPGALAAPGDPRDWLLAQLRPVSPSAFAGLPDSAETLRRELAFRRERLAERRAARDPLTASADAGSEDARNEIRTRFRQTFGRELLAELAARYRHAVRTEQDFLERLVQFWSNHFAVSIDKRQAALYAAPMEREAIRPHVLGRFGDLLLAVESHPGMLRYLDNARSIGEGSWLARVGSRRMRPESGPTRKLGLNENLAREILELHTLGVDGGYDQADVLELARALTGWGTAGRRELRAGGPLAPFAFRSAAHEPGARRLLGRRYPEGGVEQARAMLSDLARHPATARHLAFKLARHFVADQPPPALVDRLARTWLDGDGDLPAVYAVLVRSDEAWSASARKFKTPNDFVLSAARGLGIDLGARPEALVGLFRRLGQPPFLPRSPAGFADTAADWSGADALGKRVQLAQALAARAPAAHRQPLATARAMLGRGLDTDLGAALRRAESAEQGLALLLASPSFQWRT